MRILFLCEGDAESAFGSFSGISRSIVEGLRAAGDEVVCADCDLLGWEKVVGAVPVFSQNRRRWAARYHLARWPFALRSRRAKGHFGRLRETTDVVLQIGATFNFGGAVSVPYFLF